jgi:hypothetical protein
MAQLTAKQFVQKLEDKIKALDERNTPLEEAVRSITGLQVIRIFQNGLKSDGTKIGTYSTKPAVISSKYAPVKFKDDTFVPFNKSQRSKTGKKGYYGKFFASGYKGFRQSQGREFSFVNIRLSNDLQSDYCNAELSATQTTLATPSPIKVNVHQFQMTLKRLVNQKKKQGLEAKYGLIFNHTAKEKETFRRVASAELRRFLAT